MLCHSFGIFGVEIVEAALGLEFGDHQGLIAQHRGGQLAPADIWFGQQVIEFLPRPFGVLADRVAVIALGGDDRHADRRALVDRLQHIRPFQRIAFENLGTLDDPPARHWDAVGDQRLLGQFLVDRDYRSDHAGMGIGQPHQVHHALDRAVFPRRAVQRVEHHVGRGLGQLLRDIAAHVDAGDLVPTRFQRRSYAFPAH